MLARFAWAVASEAWSALSRLLSSADRKVVEGAVEAAQRLTPLEPCGNVEALMAKTSPPDEAARAEVERVRGDDSALWQIDCQDGDAWRWLIAACRFPPAATTMVLPVIVGYGVFRKS